ncbi:MAG: 30S ribosomal protein S8 [Candidatus Saccharimonadales bacterium]
MSVTSTDPIADMLTRIRNAINVQKSEVNLPHSRVKEAVARILKEAGFITGVRVTDLSVGKQLTVTINANSENARITEIKRLSTPGRRHYANVKEIPKIKNGRGIVIVSTSRGIMTGEQARKQQVGGELIASVY